MWYITSLEETTLLVKHIYGKLGGMQQQRVHQQHFFIIVVCLKEMVVKRIYSITWYFRKLSIYNNCNNYKIVIDFLQNKWN